MQLLCTLIIKGNEKKLKFFKKDIDLCKIIGYNIDS